MPLSIRSLIRLKYNKPERTTKAQDFWLYMKGPSIKYIYIDGLKVLAMHQIVHLGSPVLLGTSSKNQPFYGIIHTMRGKASSEKECAHS